MILSHSELISILGFGSMEIRRVAELWYSNERLMNSVEFPDPISMNIDLDLAAAHINDMASNAGMKWFFPIHSWCWGWLLW